MVLLYQIEKTASLKNHPYSPNNTITAHRDRAQYLSDLAATLTLRQQAAASIITDTQSHATNGDIRNWGTSKTHPGTAVQNKQQ